MSTKKTTKAKNVKASEVSSIDEGVEVIKSSADLTAFLQGVKDKLDEEIAAPVYVLSALQFVMNLSNVYEYLNTENRQLARDLWLRVKAAGFQLRNPPLFFKADEGAAQV